MVEDLHLTRSIGLNPDGRLSFTDITQQRPNHKTWHPADYPVRRGHGAATTADGYAVCRIHMRLEVATASTASTAEVAPAPATEVATVPATEVAPAPATEVAPAPATAKVAAVAIVPVAVALAHLSAQPVAKRAAKQ